MNLQYQILCESVKSTNSTMQSHVENMFGVDLSHRAFEVKVYDLIEEQLGVPANRITNRSNIIHDLGGDNLDLIELAISLEDAFNITISEHDAAHWRTVGDIIKYLQQHTTREGK